MTRTGRNQADPKTELPKVLLLESASMHAEAELRWLDIVEARLDELRRQPPQPSAPRQRGRPRASEQPVGKQAVGSRQSAVGGKRPSLTADG